MSSWESAVIAHLVQLRARHGRDFTKHWRLALRMYPPKGRDAGAATPRLFDEEGRAPETHVEFFKAACRNAYDGEVGPVGSGNGPRLRYFNAEMLRDLDSSSPASGRIRQAA